MRKRGSTRLRNIALIVLSLGMAYFFALYEPLHVFLLNLGPLKYLGIVVAGMAFSSTFLIASASVLLLVFGENTLAWQVGLLAGLGAAMADVLILKLVRLTIIPEAKKLIRKLKGTMLARALHSKYAHWTIPLIGVLIIASPFPDELGVALVGLSGMRGYQFFLISLTLNAIIIGLIASAASVVKL